jgi:hypothetical protein
MSQLHRIFVMMWIMAVQTLVVGVMVLKPDYVVPLLIIWWALAGVFWWQFLEAYK